MRSLRARAARQVLKKGPSSMLQRGFAFVIGAAVAAGVGAWALYAIVPVRSTPSQSNTVRVPVATREDSASPLGSDASPRAPDMAPKVAPAMAGDRFKLVGLVASGGEGLALIAVDGKPARAFRVGATVEGDIVVQQVTTNGATLGPRGAGAAMWLQVSLPPASGTAPVAAAGPELASQFPVDAPPARSQEVRSKLGSKHPPLPPPTGPTPTKPADGTAGSADGRWVRPSGP